MQSKRGGVADHPTHFVGTQVPNCTKPPWMNVTMQVSDAKKLIWDEAIKDGSVVAYSEADKLVRLPPATRRATMSVATASMVSPKAHAAMRHIHHLGLLQDSDLSTHHEGSRAFRSTCPLCHAILRSCRQAYTKFTHRARRFPSVHNVATQQICELHKSAWAAQHGSLHADGFG